MDDSEKQQPTPGHAALGAVEETNVKNADIVETKEAIRSTDHDDAAELFSGAEDSFEYTEKEATWVRWKLDLILLTMLTLTYIFSFIDKVALSEASIFGIRDDDHLVGQQYSWVNSIFYFGYLVAQYPSSVLMQKLPIGKYFGVMVLLWGMVTTCMAATNSFATLATCRFFLGAFETCLSPILTVIVGQYWTRREQPLRASIWWAGGGIGSFIADSITYGVSGNTSPGAKYATWQVIFLIFGPLTIGWGIFLYFCLPTSPMTAWFLTERERKIAVMRVIKNHTGIENRRYKVSQVKEALTDPQAWMLCAMALLQCIPGGALTSFDKIVLTGLGYSDRQATLMSFPEDTIQLCSVIIAGVASQVFSNFRCGLMILANIIVLIGAVLVSTLPDSNAHGRLGAFYILFVNTIPYIMCISLVSSNIGGFTKKATCGVMMFMGYSVGQIITPNFFLASESPRYPTGFRAVYVSVCLMIVIEIAMIIYLYSENRRRDRQAAAPGGNASAAYDFLDLTDKEHANFRYVY